MIHDASDQAWRNIFDGKIQGVADTVQEVADTVQDHYGESAVQFTWLQQMVVVVIIVAVVALLVSMIPFFMH